MLDNFRSVCLIREKKIPTLDEKFPFSSKG
jgi:hypothetical protein